jgi:hypothetical protein
MLLTQADITNALAPFARLIEDPYYAFVKDEAVLIMVPGGGPVITYGDLRHAARMYEAADKIFGYQPRLPLDEEAA